MSLMHASADMYPWVSAAALAWGLLDCFFGYRIFRVTVALLGAFAGAVFGQAAGVALGLGPNWEIGGIIVGALLGAGLAFVLYLGAVFLAGFGFGATLGVLLLSHYNQMVALLTACILGVIGGIAAVKLQRIILILATALIGSFRAFVALLYFTQSIDWIFYFRQPQQIPALVDAHRWLLPAVLILAALGTLSQLEIVGSGGGKKAPKDKPAEKKK